MMEANPATPRYADGSRVLGADGLAIGEVVAIYREHLIVERGYFFPTDYYIPFSAVANAGGGDIVLSLSRREALAQGWNVPPADPIVAPAAPLPAPPPDPSFPAAAEAKRPRRPATVPAPADSGAPSETSAPLTDSPEVPSTTAAPVAATPQPVSEEGAAADTVSVPSEPSDAAVVPSPDAAADSEGLESVVAAVAPEAAEKEGPPAAKGPAPATEDPGPATASTGPEPSVEDSAPDLPADDATETAPADGPPAEPEGDATPEEPAGSTATPPPFVGIPGRRLTDAELWSLLEPKESDPANAKGDQASPEGDASDRPTTTEKPEP